MSKPPLDVPKYLREKLLNTEESAKMLKAAVQYTAPGGKWERPVVANVFDMLNALEVWQQDELEVALEEGEFGRCVERIVDLDVDTSLCYDENPQYDAMVALRRTILEASRLTNEVCEALTHCNDAFVKTQERRTRKYDRENDIKDCGCRRRQYCRKCKYADRKCKYAESFLESGDSDEESDPCQCPLVEILDGLPLVKDLIAEFGTSEQHKAKIAKLSGPNDV